MSDRVVASREVKVGPLFPAAYAHEEVGIGAREGITGLKFTSVSADAVKLTPPSQMVTAAEYPNLEAEILNIIFEEEASDLWDKDDEAADEIPDVISISIRICVRNTGSAVVERTLSYYKL